LKTLATTKFAEASVEYDEVGWLDENFFKFRKERKKTIVKFQLEKKEAIGWIVCSYGWDSPHIYWQSAVKHLENIAQTAYNPDYFRGLAREIETTAKNR
jgi:hypothetical protein